MSYVIKDRYYYIIVICSIPVICIVSLLITPTIFIGNGQGVGFNYIRDGKEETVIFNDYDSLDNTYGNFLIIEERGTTYLALEGTMITIQFGKNDKNDSSAVKLKWDSLSDPNELILFPNSTCTGVNCFYQNVYNTTFGTNFTLNEIKTNIPGSLGEHVLYLTVVNSIGTEATYGISFYYYSIFGDYPLIILMLLNIVLLVIGFKNENVIIKELLPVSLGSLVLYMGLLMQYFATYDFGQYLEILGSDAYYIVLLGSIAFMVTNRSLKSDVYKKIKGPMSSIIKYLVVVDLPIILWILVLLLTQKNIHPIPT